MMSWDGFGEKIPWHLAPRNISKTSTRIAVIIVYLYAS
jgi:hypothetical protein